MAATANRTGRAAVRQRPPPKIFLGIGGVFFLLNHLSVVFGVGLQAEALFMGSWLVLMGGWVLVAGRSFDAAWAWADPYGRRVLGFVALTFAAAYGLAAAVAWWGYREPLFG